jgi:hypothetical protein
MRAWRINLLQPKLGLIGRVSSEGCFVPLYELID